MLDTYGYFFFGRSQDTKRTQKLRLFYLFVGKTQNPADTLISQKTHHQKKKKRASIQNPIKAVKK